MFHKINFADFKFHAHVFIRFLLWFYYSINQFTASYLIFLKSYFWNIKCEYTFEMQNIYFLLNCPHAQIAVSENYFPPTQTCSCSTVKIWKIILSICDFVRWNSRNNFQGYEYENIYMIVLYLVFNRKLYGQCVV